MLLERLAFEECRLERIAERGDGIGEDMVEHGRLAGYPDPRGTLAPMSGSAPLVLTAIADGVATLTLNNPDERNTLTAPMVAEIIAAMEAFEADESVGAVVVTGTPPAFCAGANLGNLAEATGESLGTIYEGFLRIARSPLPTLAAVNGAAVGAGMNLALGCDVRIVADDGQARHALPPARASIPVAATPGCCAGSSAPRPPWRRWCSDRSSTARRPSGSGSPTGRCPTDSLLAVAHEMAARAAAAPRELAIVTKRTIQDMADVDDHPAAVARELEPQLWSTQQPWFAERLAALQARISTK